MAFWRWTFAILVLPGTVLGWIPWLLFTAFPVPKTPPYPAPCPDALFTVFALPFLLAGVGLCLTTMNLFRRFGDGTPAPWDPPRRFVIRGPYRHVRNPMILGVILLLIAEALFLRSWPIAIWAAVFFIGNAIYFPLKEEPALRKRFGDDYRVYCENVRRWIPRLRPWDPPARGHDGETSLTTRQGLKLRSLLLFLPLLIGNAIAGSLEIRPDRGASWGAPPANVQAVLDSAAGELAEYFPGIDLEPILVEPRGGPIVLYRRGPRGEFLVKLNTGKTYWAQYSYQFAHELCHIYCRHDRDRHPNKWFEESLCELASLFVLRRMGESWNRKPPYPNWKSFGKELTAYAQDRIDGASLPDSKRFTDWFAEERESLSRDAVQRRKNTVVASVLLDLFEAQPEHWAAVHYLNESYGSTDQTFEAYLSEWRDNAPRRHRRFVQKVAARFGVSPEK